MTRLRKPQNNITNTTGHLTKMGGLQDPKQCMGLRQSREHWLR